MALFTSEIKKIYDAEKANLVCMQQKSHVYCSTQQRARGPGTSPLDDPRTLGHLRVESSIRQLLLIVLLGKNHQFVERHWYALKEKLHHASLLFNSTDLSKMARKDQITNRKNITDLTSYEMLAISQTSARLINKMFVFISPLTQLHNFLIN